MAPLIFFVPGLWEGPSVFGPVSALLHASSLTTDCAALLSTGRTSPNNPNMDDDIATVREHLSHVVESGADVLLVCHSAGGFIGSSAMKDLAAPKRKQEGKKGGVVKMVFLAGAVLPEGFEHHALPFYDIEGGAMHCKNPTQLLFGDLPAAETEKWMKVLQPQPAEGWDSTIKYCGWKDVPSVYLICEGDQVVPPPMQAQMAEAAGSEVVKCGSGHMCMLSQTERVAEVIKAALEGL